MNNDHTMLKKDGSLDEDASSHPVVQAADDDAQTRATRDAATGPAGSAAEENPEDLKRQRDEYYDLLLRKAAEFDNYRKRVDRERREQGEATTASVIEELLPLIDDLERALKTEARGDDIQAYRKGVELIHQRLLDFLRKRGVTPIQAVGADFDPHLHEAVVHEVSPEHREGEVIEEFGRGYRLGNRLLRPAMVKVAKA